VSGFPWTAEQNAVLGSSVRVVVCQAGPGSGKTKVFAEMIKRRLHAWGRRPGGLAALSFTNVAREEIAERVGEASIAPHFVGTLDSFFLRFVVAPFGHMVGMPSTGARLIPSPFDQQLSKPDVSLGDPGKQDRVSIFAITPVSGTEGTPGFVVRRPYGRPTTLVESRDVPAVRGEKQKEWQTHGRITHGDSHYLAACLLRGPHGPAVRKLVAARFPVIYVDEFQDTGHFLGRAVLSLLAEPSIASLLVGDVDQKIFGFSGVSPDLFSHAEKLDGAAAYPMKISQRCSTRVSAVACGLSRSGAKVLPAHTAEAGRAVLLTHQDQPSEPNPIAIERAVAIAEELGCKQIAVLTRKVVDKMRLLRGAKSDAPPLECRGVRLAARAVEALKDGRGYLAIEIAESLLCRALLGDDRPTRSEMRSIGVDPEALRHLARCLVLAVVGVVPNETWDEWADRVKRFVDSAAAQCGVTNHKQRLGGLFKKNKKDRGAEIRTAADLSACRRPQGMAVEYLTVHEAKGREFDAVLYYCPRPRKGSLCPSASWWSAPPDEEREVAFVAATRARRLFVLAVHEMSWNALRDCQPGFVGLFATEAIGHPVGAKCSET